MAGIDTLPPLRDVIEAHGIAAKKALGQNFLLDLNLTARIARAAGDLTACDVLEIGPGPGGLTRGLLAEGARHVLAIEKDARCLPALAQIAAAYPGRLTVIQGDALAIDPFCRITTCEKPAPTFSRDALERSGASLPPHPDLRRPVFSCRHRRRSHHGPARARALVTAGWIAGGNLCIGPGGRAIAVRAGELDHARYCPNR